MRNVHKYFTFHPTTTSEEVEAGLKIFIKNILVALQLKAVTEARAKKQKRNVSLNSPSLDLVIRWMHV